MAPRSESHTDIDELLEHYWLDKAEGVDAGAVEAWLAERPKFRGLVNQLYQGIKSGRWIELTPAEEDVRVERILGAIRGRTTSLQRQISKDGHSRGPHGSVRGGRWTNTRARLFGVVSVTVAAFAFFVLTIGHYTRSDESRLLEHASIYTASNGARAMVDLPDGSTVMLNAGTRLEVPAKFAIGKREVFLEGEAIFNVEHDQRAPFQVKTLSSTVRVLGTNFVVSQYSESDETLVAVRDGRVAVGKTVVAARQQLIVEAAGHERFSPFDPGVFSFEQGVLTLSKSSLKGAIGKLNRWYNADIRFGDRSVENLLISGTLAAGSPSDLIEYLKLMYGIRAVRDGRVVTLYSGGETQ